MAKRGRSFLFVCSVFFLMCFVSHLGTRLTDFLLLLRLNDHAGRPSIQVQQLQNPNMSGDYIYVQKA